MSVYYLLYISFFITGSCFAISCRLLFKRDAPIYLKLFPAYLLCSLIAEIIGYKVWIATGNNYIVFNIYNVLSFTFYLFIFWRILDKGRSKIVAFYSFLIIPVIAIGNMIFLQGVHYYNTFTHSISATLIVLFAINSLYQLFMKTPTKVPVTHLPDFWIGMGLLVFYGVTFVGFNAHQPGMQHSDAARQILFIILMLSQFFLYINFSIGFFCALNQQPARESAPPITKESDPDDFSF